MIIRYIIITLQWCYIIISMNDLSKNFSRKEFACRCGCGFDTVDYMLIYVLEFLRFYYKARIFINCGCRCKSHNKKVGGVKDSQHLIGRAGDIVVEGVSPQDLYLFLCDAFPGQYAIGLYKTFVHFDTRSSIARWDKTLVV